MADNKLNDEQKKALAELRQRMGGVSEAKRQLKTQLSHDRKAIVATLAKGPATVPEIADATQLSKRHVLWCLTGMRKYGQVMDRDAEGDYPRYAIVKED